ncbi:MAG: cupin domain-containing protein [Paracoccaceae bacterium]|nr:cupin domain-containing protein [Paracoccaceae bacterium]
MELNADFTRRAAVHAGRMDWVASPMPGVERRMLDRIGDEVARATTIVRFAPGSAFSPHTHDGGEEFLVLDGVFQDEYGDFPAGTYVRNPPTTRHTPASTPGCTIFVKLWQFDAGDRNQFHVDTEAAEYRRDPARPGVSALELHRDAREVVTMERWEPGAQVALQAEGGMEVLVVRGGFAEGGDDFTRQSWLRLPQGAASVAVTGAEGAQVWIKRGHLAGEIGAPG